MTLPGIVVAAPSSGSGKTTVTLGLLAAFRAAGVAVQPFKGGPDYIDPAFHTAAAGRASLNLDSWAMTGPDIAARIGGTAAFGSPPQVERLPLPSGERDGVRGHHRPALAIAEGAMGLFDGVAHPGACGSGACADIAALTGWPVVLVLDTAGQAQTAGAVAAGLARFRTGVHVAGVILNRVASPRHEAMLRAGMAEAGLPVFGAIPRDAGLALPARHLGLVQAREQGDLPAFLAHAAATLARTCDLGAIRAAATPFAATGTPRRLPPPGMRVALARDDAFSFIYPHILGDWCAGGATILPFSPLADQPPDPTADACWLPGGYPELHAGRLAAANRFRTGLRDFARTRPVHGECGGYMAMGAGLVDADGTRHEMAGLLGLVTSYAARRMHLGYRRATLNAPAAGLAAGTALVGHEFHYSTVTEQPDTPLARVTDAAGTPVSESGSRRGLATGSFLHLIGPAP
ncbi:MAG: cobyrinate a,c-diamide synthase [Gemmobacter sp.]